MNTATAISTVTVPDHLDALCSADLTEEQFVDALQDLALRSRAVEHPLLKAIAQGRFNDLAGAIRNLLTEYYAYSYRFTRYLAATMAGLDNPEHRAALVGNSAEEAGIFDDHHKAELIANGIDPADVSAAHPELFRRFLGAIGMDRKQMLARTPNVATSAWIDTVEEIYRHGGQEQAIGAIGIATEGIVREMYVQLLQGISRAWPNLSKFDRAFFDLHAAVDDEHAEVLRNIAVGLVKTPESRRRMAVGVSRALAARVVFFDEMFVYLQRMDAAAAPTMRPTPALAFIAGANDSASFTDVGKNRNSLEPIPALQPSDACVHADVSKGSMTKFAAERGHPVYPIKLPSRSVSMSIGELSPGASTSNHRHAYESMVYVTKGAGYTMMEGKRFDWKEGDAFYTPPWCWHQHFANPDSAVEYLTATNMPMLHAIGQTVLRQEAAAE